MAERDHGAMDAALVDLARRDAGAGWEAIWDTHGAALHGHCRRLLDDPADADDVVADVFLVAAQRLDQLRDPTALRAWLFSISRRSVQRRWRARTRTVPVDPQGVAVMNRATDTTVDEQSSIGSQDAAELVDAASAGLSIEDRELLALTLVADLDTTEVARVTGQKQSAVSVRVSRLKDTVARAAGALLVARHHRRDCDVLDGLLAEWDGTFDPLWRKRIARHVDDCETCDDRRRGAVAAFASPLFLAPTPDGLRDRVLASIDASSPRADASDSSEAGSFSADGFPEPRPWTAAGRVRPATVLAIAMGVVLVIVAGLALWGDEGDADIAAIADAAPSTTAASTSSSVATTTEPEEPSLSTPDDGPGDATPPPSPTIAPPPSDQTPIPPPPPPASPAPLVSITVAPDTFVGCGTSAPTADALVEVGAGAGGETTTVSWDGGAPGSVVVAGAGTHEVEVGPLERVPSGPISQTITVTAVTVDENGGTATDTHEVTIEVVPC